MLYENAVLFSATPKLKPLEVEDASLLMPKLKDDLSPVEDSALGALPSLPDLHATHTVSPALLRTKQLLHSHEPAAGLNMLARELRGGLSSFFADSFGAVVEDGIPKLN